MAKLWTYLTIETCQEWNPYVKKKNLKSQVQPQKNNSFLKNKVSQKQSKICSKNGTYKRKKVSFFELQRLGFWIKI